MLLACRVASPAVAVAAAAAATCPSRSCCIFATAACSSKRSDAITSACARSGITQASTRQELALVRG